LGTYANLLCKDLKFNRISISEEIRKLVRRKSMIKIDEKMLKENLPVLTQGKIVTNDLAIEIIKEKLKETASEHGVTIGGFPRNLVQAESYEKSFPIDLVVYLRVDEDILMETLLGRRSCFKCGLVYNLCKIHRNDYELDKILPKNEGRCDSCNERLSKRPDDNIETIYSRIYNYRSEGLKVLDYFKKKELVYEFEPKKGVKDYPRFFEKALKLLKNDVKT
jgi:adenylate kinase